VANRLSLRLGERNLRPGSCRLRSCTGHSAVGRRVVTRGANPVPLRRSHHTRVAVRRRLADELHGKAAYGPAGRSWLKVALAVAGSWLIILLWFAAWSRPTWSAEWVYSHPNAIVLAGFLILTLHVCALAQSSLLRRRYQEE
jgi:hypothetical protein